MSAPAPRANVSIRFALEWGYSEVRVIGNPHAAAFYRDMDFVPVGEEHTAFGPAPRLSRR